MIENRLQVNAGSKTFYSSYKIIVDKTAIKGLLRCRSKSESRDTERAQQYCSSVIPNGLSISFSDFVGLYRGVWI